MPPDTHIETLNAEAESKTANENASIGAASYSLAGKISEQQLRAGACRAHKLATVELQVVLAIVLVKIGKLSPKVPIRNSMIKVARRSGRDQT